MVLIQLNNQTLQRINNYQALEKVTLTINNIVIILTKSFAVAISQFLYSQSLLNNDINKIDITTEIKSQDTYKILKDVLQYNKTEIECDETVMKDLYHIGIALEIKELIDWYKSQIMDEIKLDKENCIETLEFYFDISSNEKVSECIEFISSHFHEINADHLKAISKKLGIEFVKKILNNKELQINNEDSVADFVISLVKEDQCFSPLFDVIYFELCSEKVFNEIKSLITVNNYQNFVNLLFDSIKRGRNSVNESHKVNNYFHSGNVEMSASTVVFGSIEIINALYNNHVFETANIPNSWIQWKLKPKYEIQPTEYIVRSSPAGTSCGQLQTWIVEGTTINGETKVIHTVNSDALRPGEIRKYKINTQDKFVSFKLIQTQASTTNSDYLHADIFDFSGIIFKDL